jgi:lipoyl(octanoyl) transferase
LSRPLHVHFIGRRPYREVWAWQRSLVARRKAGEIPDTLLLLEHEPVVTLGRNAGAASLLFTEGALADRGVELVVSDRGGDATFHGPGQVVGYPIMDLAPDRKDVRRFVRDLEWVMAETSAAYGLATGRIEGAPGCWLHDPDRKIGAIGCRFSRWVTHHGFAFNVNTNLAFFDLIVPCGLRDKGVTSLAAEIGRRVSVAEVMEQLADRLAYRFERTRVEADLELVDTAPAETG